MYYFLHSHGLIREADLSGLADVVVAWEVQVTIDVLVISFTVYKSWQTSRAERKNPFQTSGRLLYVIYRDCQLSHPFLNVGVLD